MKTHGVELTVEEYDQSIEIECQPIPISQVLLNLINNAYDAVKGKDPSWVKVRVEDLGDRVRLIVSDSGPGIPEEVRVKMLDPFYTTKPVGVGTGLGLSISRGIAETHHGGLEYSDKCGNTCFIVSASASLKPVRSASCGVIPPNET